MYEEIRKGCYWEIGAMIGRLIVVTGIFITFITITTVLGIGGLAGVISGAVINAITPDEELTRAVTAGAVPALAFLVIVGAKKGITGHVIHAEWWNGMHALEKAFSLLLMAFIIGMTVFSLTYWLMTR